MNECKKAVDGSRVTGVVRMAAIKYLMVIGSLTAGCRSGKPPERASIRLITLDPGHFHAALVQKSGYADIDTVVHVYAPDGVDQLKTHLALIAKYNSRAQDPTSWKEKVYQGPDFLEKMFSEKAGNVVVLAGNNKRKIDYIRQSVDSGLHVFADKPMVIEPADLPKLEAAFEAARQHHVILYDMMTERYQVTTILQRRLSQDRSVFGVLEKGTAQDPAVTKESVHHFFKYVSGRPLTRPAWYFDVTQEGEGIVDVTTHLVDLIQWECFPDSVLDYRKDIVMESAKRWPTILSPAEYMKVTGIGRDSALSVYANGEMNYILKGVHARVSVQWNFEAPEGTGDTHYSVLRGSLANLVIRQGKEEHYKPVLYVEPVKASAAFDTALATAVRDLQGTYPGLSVERTDSGWRMLVPDKFSPDHEATFAEVTKKFLRYVKTGTMPAWEVPAMLAKYYTTMKALEIARGGAK